MRIWNSGTVAEVSTCTIMDEAKSWKEAKDNSEHIAGRRETIGSADYRLEAESEANSVARQGKILSEVP